MSIKYEEFDQLPFMLNAKDLVRILHISRSEVYAYMHSKDFPTTTIGIRMLVRKDKLIEWLDRHTGTCA